jgi:hypothetical protein
MKRKIFPFLSGSKIRNFFPIGNGALPLASEREVTRRGVAGRSVPVQPAAAAGSPRRPTLARWVATGERMSGPTAFRPTAFRPAAWEAAAWEAAAWEAAAWWSTGPEPR